MNQDASSATSASQLSPTQGYISPGSDSGRLKSHKRASRAGTRSVTTLSAAQLERKRANDREAQRAIRQRTKDHIETLERRINELTAAQESRDKMITATQQRNRELEEEVAYLRSRLGNDTFALNVTEAASKDKPADYSVSAPASSPQSSIPRHSPASTTRSMPMAPLHASHPNDSWRGHGSFATTGAPASTTFLSDAASGASNSGPWRAQEVTESSQARIDQGHRTFPAGPGASDRSPWASSTPSYGYGVRSGDRTSNYASAPQPLSYPTPTQPPQFQTTPAAATELPPVSAAFHTPGLVPSGDYQQMSSYSTSQQPSFHDQSQSHGAYQVGPAQVSPSGDFHGATSNVQRGSLAPPTYNPAGGSPHFMHSQSNHGQSLPLAYREGASQHQYSYET